MAAVKKHTHTPCTYSTVQDLEAYALRVRILEEKRPGFDDMLAFAREEEAKLRATVARWFDDWAAGWTATD